MIKLYAPILSYTMEEAYWIFEEKGEKSVFLTRFPEVKDYADADALEAKWDKFMVVRSDILKALEEAKTSGMIKKALEAKVVLKVKEGYEEVLEGLSEHEIAQLVIASQAEVSEEEMNEYQASFVKIEKFDGVTCPRCWNVVPAHEVDENGLCLRCQKVLK